MDIFQRKTVKREMLDMYDSLARCMALVKDDREEKGIGIRGPVIPRG